MTNAVLDKETFCRLVEEHQSALYRTARSILSNQQDAEDAVQEAVCAAYSHLGRLREPEKFKSWLLRILVNECYDLCRRQRRTVDFDQAAEYLTTPEPDLAEHLTLWDAVLQLPEPMRAAVTLFYYEDCSVAETAQILKISQEPVSLETPIGEEEDSHLGDFIQDDNVPVPADAAAFTLLKEQLVEVLSTLTDREQKVLRLRFGLDDGRARTLEEVGKEFNVTRERIRQIEAKALRKLRHPSRSRKLKDYLD